MRPPRRDTRARQPPRRSFETQRGPRARAHRAVRAQSVLRLERDDRPVCAGAEDAVFREGCAELVEALLQREDVRAAVAYREQRIGWCRRGLTELASRLPAPDQLVSDFEMHGVLGAEAGAPK